MKTPAVILCILLLFGAQPLFPEAQSVEILCKKSFFTPDTIHVAKGTRVRLILKSADVTHGFAIDEFDIAKEVSPGPPTVVEFTPERSGSFAYYCVVRCGKGHLKMRGTLVVE